MSAESTPTPPRISPRSWLALAAIILVGIGLYLWVVIVYNTEGGYTTKVDQTGIGSATYETAVDVQPTAFDSQTNTAALQMVFQIADWQSGLVDGKGELTENVRFIIDGSAGTQEIRFPAGSRLSAKDVTITTEGPSWEYPFDVHEAAFDIEAETYIRQPDGSFETDKPLTLAVVVDTQAQANGGVTGWDTTIAAGTYLTYTNFDVTFTRGFSTKVFSMMLLALAVLLATATAVVAFLVAANQRRAEIGLMAWTASLLFALPALRSFMPNSPPIGAQIDMYVYLWVMAAAIVAAITMIISWVRQSKRQQAADATGASGGVPRIPEVITVDTTGD